MLMLMGKWNQVPVAEHTLVPPRCAQRACSVYTCPWCQIDPRG
jgi:hypothetical protein